MARFGGLCGLYSAIIELQSQYSLNSDSVPHRPHDIYPTKIPSVVHPVCFFLFSGSQKFQTEVTYSACLDWDPGIPLLTSTPDSECWWSCIEVLPHTCYLSDKYTPVTFWSAADPRCFSSTPLSVFLTWF